MITFILYSQHKHELRANILSNSLVITVEDYDRKKKIILPPIFTDDVDIIIDQLKILRREINDSKPSKKIR